MKRYLYIFAALLAMTACEKDGDRLIARLDSDATAAVKSFDDDIVITKETNDRLVLTLYWDEAGTFSLNIPEATVPESILRTALQFSPDETFSTVYEYELAPGSISAQFTGKQLNVVISRLGLEAGVRHKLYLRLLTALGTNTQPRYGVPVCINVTGFHIDMSAVKLLDKDKTSETGRLGAVAEGEYAGITYTSAGWMNFWFEEGDGTVWGTANDGTTGTPFLLSSDGAAWNNWFPEPQGLFYVTMNSVSAQWTASYLDNPAVTIGETQTAMTYAAESNTLGCTFETSENGASLGLQQSVRKYDQSTGDQSYSSGTISFAANSNGTFQVGEGELMSGITAGAAGTYTLMLHFDDMTWELREGEHEIGGGETPEPEVPVDPGKTYEEFLYCHYAWDSGTYWEEAWAATLWSEAKDGIYTGYLSTPSDWTKPYTNFVFSSSAVQNDESATRYGCDKSDNSKLVTPATSGYAMWPSQLGLLKMTADLRSMSWSHKVLGAPSVNGSTLTFSTTTLTWEGTCEVSDKGLIVTFDDRTMTEQAEAGTYAVSLDLRDMTDIKVEYTKQ